MQQTYFNCSCLLFFALIWKKKKNCSTLFMREYCSIHFLCDFQLNLLACLNCLQYSDASTFFPFVWMKWLNLLTIDISVVQWLLLVLYLHNANCKCSMQCAICVRMFWAASHVALHGLDDRSVGRSVRLFLSIYYFYSMPISHTNGEKRVQESTRETTSSSDLNAEML